MAEARSRPRPSFRCKVLGWHKPSTLPGEFFGTYDRLCQRCRRLIHKGPEGWFAVGAPLIMDERETYVTPEESGHA